ncbi:CvpA family protein [Halioglobus sp. Uisw_031]|jgi:membrane protein required for colicin V production|uniref:CvpA family protein n=1 Tax=Halioglobus sp. Uisw_031 TaxID=3230977 RepID=UPI0039E97E85|tara:strand:- start:550 stop:1035 length:486 start_codon:yes stop_codon:yes gene_type:complete
MVDWVNFTAVDWAIIAVLGLSILLSLWRGFVREAVSLAGWIAAFVIANMFVGEMAAFLQQWIANVTGRYVAAYALLFAGMLMVAGIAGKLSAQVVKVTGLTLLDRLLGTVFGFARGIIIVLVVVYVLRQLAPPQNVLWLDESQLMPHVDMLGQWVQALFSR